MKITARSTLEEVAAAVGGALKTSGIRAVLTGGGCAAVWSIREGAEKHFEEFERELRSARRVR